MRRRLTSLILGAPLFAVPALAQTDCGWNPDYDGDNQIGVADLMALLGVFGEVDLDDDGIWESQDDSLGVVHPCTDGPLGWGGATTMTFDGYTYELVAIGSQCWFAENLRTEHYANGDPIPGNLTNSEWTSTTSGAQAISDNNSANLETYGRLYNWYAVDDARGLCPSGWHVPTDAEWTELSEHLGGSTEAGIAMKSSPTDNPSWNGTNISGFSALPGGFRNYNSGYFNGEGDTGYWWSTSPEGALSAWSWKLFTDFDFVYPSYYSLRYGFSVRCLKE